MTLPRASKRDWAPFFARITSSFLVPSQYYNSEECWKTVNKSNFRIVDTGKINIAIFPKTTQDLSKCVVYHNPNGMTIANYVGKRGTLQHPIDKIWELELCPIVMYDYQGTGINKDIEPFKPTCESIVKNGHHVLKWVMEKFETVSVWGTSLGGGVATVALERYLLRHPTHMRRILRLVNHDSFTSTPKVVLPRWPTTACIIGSVCATNLDALAAMKQLIQRKIRVIVLCHDSDPVIPLGARMADAVSDVAIIRSSEPGHGTLTFDMISKLEKVI